MSMLELRQGHQAADLAHVVSATDVTRVHGRGDARVHALRGVSVKIARGELTALVGPSGSGKSTLMHVLAGLEPATTGEVQIAGVRVRDSKPAQMRRLRRAHVGFVYQFFNVLPSLSAAENIRRPIDAAERQPDPDWIDELLELIGLASARTALAGSLSPADQQRLAIGKALALRPTVLFADEPAGTVVPEGRTEILELLCAVAARLEQTVVLATVDTDAVAIADRVLVLEAGLIVGELGVSPAI